MEDLVVLSLKEVIVDRVVKFNYMGNGWVEVVRK